eukprot:4814565-Amphidinium_carterae.2
MTMHRDILQRPHGGHSQWPSLPPGPADLEGSTAPSAPKMCPRKANHATRHQPEVNANKSAPSARSVNTSCSATGSNGHSQDDLRTGLYEPDVS